MTTFEPSFDLIQEDDCNTLLLYLPGFTKDQLRVQLTRSKVLKISGSRAIGDDKWSSFQKDFPVPENCDTSKISAKFEEGILYVRQPKLIVPAAAAEDKITPPSPPKPAELPPVPKIAPPHKTTPNLDHSPKTTPNLDGLPKTKPNQQDDSPKTTPNHQDDSKQQGSVKETQEKKKEEKQSEKVAAGRKKEDDWKVSESKSEKVRAGMGKVSESVVNAAGRLKMEREKVMKIVMLVFAFALGMYVSNKLPTWFSRN